VVGAGFAGEGDFIGGRTDPVTESREVRTWGVMRMGARSWSSNQEKQIIGSPVPGQRTRSLSGRPLGALGEFSAGKMVTDVLFRRNILVACDYRILLETPTMHYFASCSVNICFMSKHGVGIRGERTLFGRLEVQVPLSVMLICLISC